jgi:hypothetical protein
MSQVLFLLLRAILCLPSVFLVYLDLDYSELGLNPSWGWRVCSGKELYRSKPQSCFIGCGGNSRGDGRCSAHSSPHESLANHLLPSKSPFGSGPQLLGAFLPQLEHMPVWV